MTMLSRKADYALLILAELNQRPHGANARAIAAKYGISRAFVANILKELASSGLLTSHRGVKGGYSILRPLCDVTVADLLSAINEPFQLAICSEPNSAKTSCEIEPRCPMKGPLARIHRRLIGVLQEVRLSDLMEREPGRIETQQLSLETVCGD